MAIPFNKTLIKILDGYKKKAIANQKKVPFKNYEDYYRGENKGSYFNIIKTLVDTKATFILDNNITTSVIAKTVNFADMDAIKNMQDMADVLEDAKNEVYKTNKIDELNRKIVERGLKNNIAISMVNWDQSDENPLGEVKIEEIKPANFYPDSESDSVETCNYIFIKIYKSALTLKKEYPDKLEAIEKLIKNGKAEETEVVKNKNTKDIINTQTDQRGAQLYAKEENDTAGLGSQSDSLVCWLCLIKDDSVFIEEEKDPDDETKVKKIARLKYPNGRSILYAGDSLVLEDKPIDYPFGYPITVFYENAGDTMLIKGGTVNDLIFIQDRLNKAYSRLRELLGKFVSLIVIDAASGVTKNDVLTETVLELDEDSLSRGLAPQVLTNNTISEIGALTEYIRELKENAYEIARVNPQMVSGERPEGVTSGDMVIALNESAMTSIRQLQRNFMTYFVDLTNKILVLIQKYYNLERFVKISTTEMLKFPLRNDELEEGEATPEIQRIEMNKPGEEEGAEFEEDIIKVTKSIKSDPRDYEFKTEVIAGSKLPKSSTQNAKLTMDLVTQGVLGDPQDIETKKMILEALDFPNRRAVINTMEIQAKEAKEKDMQTPEIIDTASLIDKIGFSFKDLTLEEGQLDFSEPQKLLLDQLGLMPKPPEVPIEQQLPANGIPSAVI